MIEHSERMGEISRDDKVVDHMHNPHRANHNLFKCVFCYILSADNVFLQLCMG